MRYCDQCHTTYPNDFTVCPRDKSVLRITSELVQGMYLRGKYEILEKIGAGGMAAVYKARHLAFNEIRAVKVVSSRFNDDEQFLKRFRNEAIITRKLQHPNAVRVDDLDETDDGRPFMVMEYVEGRDLRDLIHKEGQLPLERALALGRQILSALAAAHALGIVHRDIKPDNILLVPQPDGSDLIKILDFGIAKVREGAFEVGGGSSATKTGVVVGTPQYLSPEQAMGKHGSDVDGRADLYSAGIVIYEMLTGRLPFESDTPIGILIKHIQTMPPPAHEVRPDLGIPKPISMVLMKALQKDRNDRFQSAEEMLDALERPEQWAATARIGAESATGRDDATAVFGSDFLANLKVAPARIPTPAHVPSAAAPRTPAPRVEPQRTPQAPSYPPISPVAPVEPVVAEPQRPARPTPPAPRPTPASQPRKPAYVPPPAPRRTWLWVLLGVVITAGAMGGGGYWYLRTQAAGVQQPAPTVSAAPPVSDTDMQTSVTSALAAYPVLQSVQASTQAGVVTLSGSVSTPAEADLAVKIAGGQRAVKDVRNQVNFPPIAPVTTQRAAQPPVPEKPAVEPKPKPSPKAAVAQEPPAPRGPSAQQRRRVQELLADGERQTNSGAYAAAIESYQSALDIDPNDAAARAGMSRAKQAMETEQEILRRRK